MASHRESDDNYDRVIAQLGPEWRVIECKDAIQWIVQRKRGKEWRSMHFCTSADGVVRRTCGLPGAEILATLPKRFHDGVNLSLSRDSDV